jgi:hypothetical protein
VKRAAVSARRHRRDCRSSQRNMPSSRDDYCSKEEEVEEEENAGILSDGQLSAGDKPLDRLRMGDRCDRRIR